MPSKKPNRKREYKLVLTSGKKNSEYTNALQSEKALIFFDLLDQAFKKAGLPVKLYKTSLPFYDKDKNIFTEYWQHKKGIEWKKYCKSIKADIIIDRSGKINFLNYQQLANLSLKKSTLLRNLVRNKYTQYLIFPNLLPYTTLINNKCELKLKLKSIKTKYKVIKPLFGQGGIGVIIGNIKDILKREKEIEYPCCLQEFIKTGQKKISDIRVILYKNKPLYYIKREAPAGSLLTNLLQGAVVSSIPKKEIPNNLKILIKDIVKKFSNFSDILYSVDFLIDNKNIPRLIEINGNPGPAIAVASGDKHAIDLHLKALVEMIKNKIAEA